MSLFFYIMIRLFSRAIKLTIPVGPKASRRESVKATFTGGADRVRLDSAREEILQDTLALFCGHATAEIFQKHWRKVGLNCGYLCYASQ